MVASYLRLLFFGFHNFRGQVASNIGFSNVSASIFHLQGECLGVEGI
jgi:hypothetical protein